MEGQGDPTPGTPSLALPQRQTESHQPAAQGPVKGACLAEAQEGAVLGGLLSSQHLRELPEQIRENNQYSHKSVCRFTAAACI